MTDRILIVEDEPSIADNIIYALASEGFEPLWCTTGKEALLQLAMAPVALMLLDVGLPDVNGFELAKRVRLTSLLPIIFVTARADEIDRVLGLELGGDDYIVKPFSPRELSARVKAVLRRSAAREAPGSAAISRSGFSLDEKRCCIRYHGSPLTLSRTEYRLLKTLIMSPGQVYNREQLMSLAWEHAEISLDRTVDTHIKTLRRKLKAVSADDDPIITHRGIGYSLREQG